MGRSAAGEADEVKGAPMRVMLVIDRLGMGGTERQMSLLATSLPPTHTPMVASLDGGGFRDVLRDAGVAVEVFTRRYRFDVTPAVRMWKAADSFRPDVVHAWGAMSSMAMVPYCRRRRVPLVDATIQVGRLPTAPPAGSRGGMYKIPSRWQGIAFADRVVANSQAGLAAFGISEDRGRVVHTGFDTSRLSAIPEAAEPSSFPALTTVVMTARMFPEKDWSTLFRAARTLVAAEAGRWRFVAVGEGPERDRLMREAEDLVAEGALVFPRAGLEVLPIVAAADIGVLLTDARIAAEGISNSILEYMACALPVICTDCGGNPEVVDDGMTGYLIPSSDDEMLAIRLRELRDDSARARSMGQAGATRLREAFSVKTMVDAYVSIYDSL
jgi:glycosyltransferase involved in cell wall biosynthesis